MVNNNKKGIAMIRQATLIFICSMLLNAVAYAAKENIRFQRINLDDGLSQEAVIAIYQDSQGFMWFGTQEGLNRYDGYQFKVFSHSDKDSGSLSNDWIHAISEDAKGNLWLGTDGGGINVFDRERQSFKAFKANGENPNSLSHDIVRVLFRDSQNNMWAGTENGLSLYESTSNNFVRFLNPTAEDRISVRSIAEDHLGFLWIGTENHGITRLDPRSGEALNITEALKLKHPLAVRNVTALLFDDNNRLWIGTYGQGIRRIDLASKAVVTFKHVSSQPDSLSNDTIEHIYSDRKGDIWVATENGVSRWDELTHSFRHFVHEPENPNSLSNNSVTRLFEDRGGVFWVGSYGGLNKWNTATSKFLHYRVNAIAAESLSDAYVNAIYAGPEGSMWVGTHGGGLNQVLPATGKIKQFVQDSDNASLPSDNRIMSLYARHADELWLGTRANGLDYFDVKAGTFKNYRHDPADPNTIGSNGVTSFSDAYGDKFWVGTFGGGLNLFDPQAETFTRISAGQGGSLSSDRVLSITKDSNGLLWIGTWGGGLNLYNPTTGSAVVFKHDSNDISTLGSDIVFSVLEDSNGNIWVGTRGGGLNKLPSKARINGNFQFERITRADGLPSNSIFGILEDSSGELWLSSNRGLTKYSPQSNTISNFDSSHGLQGNEFNSGAFYHAEDGKLWFGGTNGITAFDPAEIQPNAHVPPVVLTRFLKLNEAVPAAVALKQREAIEISYQDYLIAFEFAGLDYASPSNNRYSYRLEGFDDQWIDAGDLRRATYTNLPAGQYTFRVKASNNDGVWNEDGTALALTVLPAPWHSWWAYVLYAVAIVLGLMWLIRAYLHKLQKEAQNRIALENEVQRRTAELQKANEQLLNASVTDQLTGLHNRRYLANIVEQECAGVLRDIEDSKKRGTASEEQNPRLFFLMFDLDGFKPINDTYGHQAGDHVISQISELLQSVCRKADTLIRWGGDEFLVMGRVNNTDEVTMLAERLREKIASHFFDIKQKNRLHLSCSIGFSFYPFSTQYPQALSWEQVQVVADRALYYSKDAGRNFWTGIQATGAQPPVSLMNTLNHDLSAAVESGVVKLMTPSGNASPLSSTINK